MKVSVSPRIVTLELTESQAEVLCALLGGVVGLSDDLGFINKLFRELDDALPNREVTFSDLYCVDAEQDFIIYTGPDPV